MKPRLLSVIVPFCVSVAALRGESTAPRTEPSAFTQFIEDESGARLQTGIGSYRNKDGITVDLIGAIHIADKGYYERLNERFTRYEALLYEMVGESFKRRIDWKHARARVAAAEKSRAVPPMPAPVSGGTNAPGPAQPAANPPAPKPADTLESRVEAFEKYLAAGPDPEDFKLVQEADDESAASDRLAWLHPLYETMEKSLALTGQMSAIDYSGANFVHADMTAQQFAETQKKKGESFLKLWWKTMQAEFTHPEALPQRPGLLKILEVLCRKDSATELKRLVGRLFGSLEGMLSGLDDDDGTVILTERNKVALGVLQQQIKLGRKNIGIFYGAAHLPDMEKRLLAMGFTRTAHEWMTAWDLPPEPQPAQRPAVDAAKDGK